MSLQFLAAAALWLWRGLLAAWLLLLLGLAGLHWFIVPRIGELRPRLEARLTQALGVPLRIGALAARPDGLLPALELREVRLLDAAGRETLRLPRVLASVSPRSLWHLGFAQIAIEQPHLQARRAADGRIYVAGLDISGAADPDGHAADWFFSQAEFVVRDGSIEWSDERRGQPPLLLRQVDLVVRNGVWTHAMRLDATPPADWGARFTLMARMREPLLSRHPGRWRDWDGQLYGDFAQLDLARLGLGLERVLRLERGAGAVRVWADVQRGALSGGAADLALTQADLLLGPTRARLFLPRLGGRLGARLLAGGFEAWTEGLQFDTDDGLRWPGGNLRVLHSAAQADAPAHGELQGERLDLQALARVALRLPLEPALHDTLQALAPRGLVERVQASWDGALEAPLRYSVRGRVARFGVTARLRPPPAGTGAPAVMQWPGVQGLNADFDFGQTGGTARVQLQNGGIELPGWFEEPLLPFEQLAGELQWQIDGARLSVQSGGMRFAQPDAQGEAQFKWQTGEAGARLPGVLDLQASLSRAAGHRVYRYLPLEVPASAREYLRHAVPRAPLSGVRVRLRGDLRHFPFAQAEQGEFQVNAQLRDATFAYWPRAQQAAGEAPWPALTQLGGDLLIERDSIQLRRATARVAGANTLRLSSVEGALTGYLGHQATVSARAEARGPLAEMLGAAFKTTPLAGLTGHVFDQASAGGAADARFSLELPLAAPAQAAVQGQVVLSGNDLQLMPWLPRLQRARGVVHFSDKGFAISGGQARALGGEVRAEGGSIAVPGARAPAPGLLRLSGNFTADGLRQAREIGLLTRLGQQASGAASYTATLGWRRGVPEFHLNSTLQGLALRLPEPFGKTAEAALPLRVQLQPAPGPATQKATQDQLQVELGRVAAALYVRDLSVPGAPRVLRGALGVGLAPGEPLALPASGVAAQVELERLDLDAWRVLLPGDAGGGADLVVSNYVPTTLTLRAGELVLDGRRIRQLVAGGSRDGTTWRFNLDARELSGYLEYRPSLPGLAGRVYARLARLVLAPTATDEVEKLLDVQPESVPALDVVVGELELRGKKLGRVEIDAVNRGAREWRLNRLNVILPEARLSASGNWSAPLELTAGGARARRPAAERRRTLMDFQLDVADAGELLTRLGTKDVIRKGHGKLEGQVTWQGSPLAIDYPSLSGALTVNIEGGQFLKADPGIAKLLGVLNLQALPRRLLFDFRDVFSEGFAFDFVRGDVRIQQGVASTNNLQMKGVNAAALMEGKVDIDKETQDLKVVVVPDLNTGTASLITTWINPVAGLTSFLAQLLLRQPMIESATQEFHIDGSWSDPHVVRTDTPNGKDGGGNGGKK